MGSALKAADAQARALAAASKAGLGNKFAGDLTRLGSSAGTIDKVTRAWERYRREAGLAADASKWSKQQIGQVRSWERSHLAALKSVEAAKTRMHAPASPQAVKRAASPQTSGAATAVLAAAPRFLGPAALAYAGVQSVKKSAAAERAVTRIGVTADASVESLAKVSETAHGIAQEVAMPYASVVGGLDVLVAQGRSLQDSLAFLPSVARTASAAGAEIDDIANTADSVSSNFKIAGKDMQTAFDIMASGGKAGKFELKDMSRYLPSLGPAAAAIGFSGEKGLSDLVSMLQVMRKGSGSAEEAVSSMNNILAKMESDKTAKAFKGLGVDSEAAFKKARKEGRNLVEVFEELVDKALKGDRSRLGEIIDDMEFKRGTQALMTYRGEWQKMSATIRSTSAGSVVRDLDKVTNNVQAKLDRLANAYERRMRQIGGVISDILVPISDKIDEITEGKNPRVNAVNDRAKLVVSDHIARAEMNGEPARPYDADTRRTIDARRQFLDRQQYEEKIADLDRRIAEKEKQIASVPGPGRAAIAAGQARIRAQVAPLVAARSGLTSAQSAVDETQVRITENDAQRARLRGTRHKGFGDYYGDQPTPLAPNSSMSFGFSPHGTRGSVANGLPVAAPFPPPRPDSLPRAVHPLKSFDDIYAPQVDSTQVEAARTKAGEAKEKLSELNQTVTPTVNLASVQALSAELDVVLAKFQRIGGAAAAARSSVAGIAGEGAGRGRSDIATATADLSRSRQTNMTDRSYTG